MTQEAYHEVDAVPIELAIKAQEELERAMANARAATPADSLYLFCWTCHDANWGD